MEQKPLQYMEFEPAPDLAHVVATYWGFVVHALPSIDFRHHVWPDGCASMTFVSMRRVPVASVVVGPRIKAFEVSVRAGQRVVVVRNRAAFEARYGTGTATIAGQYSGQLNNSGDHLVLTGGLGEAILDFNYDSVNVR